MDDTEILHHIGQLADEEKQLEESHIGRELTPKESERLRSLEVSLDRCWDLLRQRRARREAGQDPNQSVERSEEVVEHYQQ